MKRVLFGMLLLLSCPALVYSATPSEESLKKVEKLSAKAAIAYDKGDYKKAYDLYNGAHTLWKNAKLTFAMIKCLEAMKQYQGALSLVKVGLKENPGTTTKARLLSKKLFFKKKLSKGSLSLLVTPSGSTITIDGKVVGQSPIEALSLPTGKHKLVVSQRNYAKIVQGITIEGGKTLRMNLTLQAITGRLSVGSTPIGANVFIDGKMMGKTPLTNLNVLVGSHLVKISRPGHQTVSRRVNISSNQSENIAVVLNAGRANQLKGTPQPWFTSWAGWTTLTLGVAAGAIGGVLLVQANQTHTNVRNIVAKPETSKLSQQELNTQWEDSNQKEKIGYALVGATGGFVILSIVLFVVQNSSQKAAKRQVSTKQFLNTKRTLLYATN